MSILDLENLKAALTPGSRLLGLDLGEKTIGIALSDTLLTVATPMETLKRGKFSADAAKLSAGASAQSARAFARNFAARSPLPLVMIDERLSTAAVTLTLLDADLSRRRRAAVVDKMAAAYILQGALDRLRQI